MENEMKTIKNQKSKIPVSLPQFKFGRYNSVASSYSNTLIQMTRENKSNLLDYVQNMNAGGGTNMNEGMGLVFQIFKATTKSSGCMKLVLFLTDGVNSQDDVDLHRVIAAENADVGARVFTFTFGATGGQPTMTKIACDHRGVSRFIPDGGDLKEAMASYYLCVIFLGAVPSIMKDPLRTTFTFKRTFKFARLRKAN
jgi:hypothetical protein